MADCVRIPVESGELNAALERFFGGLLETGTVQGVFLPMRQPGGGMVMSTLVRDPANLKDLDPLAPVTPTSAAKALCAVTARDSGFRLAAFLRPCDYRAYLELVKLKQAHSEQLLVVTPECMGRLGTMDYLALAEKEGGQAALEFHKAEGRIDGFPLLRACEVCEFPAHEGGDIQVRVLGVDLEKEVLLCAQSPSGKEALDTLGFEPAEEPDGGNRVLQELVDKRKAERDAMFQEYRDKTSSFAGLRDVLGRCINCYNCRVACPVCYCRECVFVTETFRHDPEQYFQWAEKRGRVKVPTDTLFFHLTRMLHMSTLCVGCGQCSSACPMDLPVMEVFRTVAAKTQPLFGYEPGKSLEDPLPLSTFEDQEFLDITEE